MTLDPKDNQKENPTRGLESRFDPDHGPNNPHNLIVAKERGVEYNPRSRCYEDEDGCLIYDEFGQEL